MNENVSDQKDGNKEDDRRGIENGAFDGGATWITWTAIQTMAVKNSISRNKDKISGRVVTD